MKSLLRFIYRYHHIILFVLFEIFAFLLVFQNNTYQRATFLNSSDNVVGYSYGKVYGIGQYLNLKKKNIELTNQLASYKRNSTQAYKKNKVSIVDVYDSLLLQKYDYVPCQVINNSVNKQNNHLTLNVGRKQGVETKMAVLSANGVVGVVENVSDNYASVISVLNQNLRISAMLKKNGYYGSLNWDGLTYTHANLYDLPSHISINKGDSIITSGYSAMFPKGEHIGIVESIEDEGGSQFIKVRVKLSVDFKNISNVVVVRNLLKKEQLELEKESSHD